MIVVVVLSPFVMVMVRPLALNDLMYVLLIACPALSCVAFVADPALPAEVAYLTLLFASAVLSTLESPTSLLEYDGLVAAFAHAGTSLAGIEDGLPLTLAHATELALAAFPDIEIPHVPDAPPPVFVGANEL